MEIEKREHDNQAICMKLHLKHLKKYGLPLILDAAERAEVAERQRKEEAAIGLGRVLTPHYSLTLFTPESLAYSVPLVLTRQCDRTPGGQPRGGGQADGGGGGRVIFDCHFSVQRNHFISGFLSYSVAVCLK